MGLLAAIGFPTAICFITSRSKAYESTGINSITGKQPSLVPGGLKSTADIFHWA